MLAQGLMAVESNYGALVETEASAAVLRGERQVPMRREPERAKAAAGKSGGGSGRAGGGSGGRERKAPVDLPAEAVPVFDRLRAWRGATAKEQGVPAYVIFHDATLREIATALPGSLAELSKVNGVGENKLAKYGEQILETLAATD
jgi:ATP-dependent DNA helicase RecQ